MINIGEAEYTCFNCGNEMYYSHIIRQDDRCLRAYICRDCANRGDWLVLYFNPTTGEQVLRKW